MFDATIVFLTDKLKVNNYIRMLAYMVDAGLDDFNQMNRKNNYSTLCTFYEVETQ